jgi:putative membrane protein
MSKMTAANQMRTIHTVVATCAMTLFVASGAVAAPKGQSPAKDQHFMAEAIEGDLSEVNMGKLAQQKGQSDQVKQFGQALQQDHGEHLQKAQQLADQSGMKVPSEPNKKQQAVYNKLEGLSGDRFDRAFAQAMVRDHQEDIKKYQKEAAANSPLSDFARQTVPALQKHLDMAKSLSK